MKHQKPFGMWDSPISAQMIGQGARINDVQWDSDGQTIVWLEGRSDRATLVSQRLGDANRDLLDTHIPRGRVGYGGGEFNLRNRLVCFAEKDGQLFRHSLGQTHPIAITPPFGGVASPAISPDLDRVVYVFSDGKTDIIGVVQLEGQDWPAQLVRGADFYMQPTWHPSGKMLAWVEWNHPNMPWDGTLVKIARLEDNPLRVLDSLTVGGGADRPAAQPAFSPDGRWLSFIEEADEFENLILVDLQTNSREVLVTGDGFHLMTPAWGQGQRHIGWCHDSQSLFALKNYAGFATLWRFGLDGSQTQIPTDPYTWLSQVSASPTANQVAFIASAPTVPTRLVLWNGSEMNVLARTSTETTPTDYLAVPRAIEWKASDGAAVHGLYYPPTNPAFSAEGPPPALLNIHGGPTSQAVAAYSAETAFFTSRGYAYVQVNYRGSSGYGRTYRNALRQRWGETDVDDAVSCVAALEKLGLADPKRCIITGGSAGGYTVLNALVHHPGVFKAGVCLFGVSNLFALDLDTHKFEQHYNQSLVGKLPEASGRYHAWSPAFHADKIRDPLIVFQGSDDKVVTPSQSEEVVAVLRRTGVPHRYIVYEGEGHGFRKSENITNYLNETERFLMQHVLFAP